MKNGAKLIDAFGEFIYLMTMADGEIQAEEVETIERLLSKHKWGEDIKWSFQYERNKKRPLDKVYDKVLSYCEMHGPAPEYASFLKIAEEIAAASNGIDKAEQAVMDNFKSDLINKFKADVERINRSI